MALRAAQSVGSAAWPDTPGGTGIGTPPCRAHARAPSPLGLPVMGIPLSQRFAGAGKSDCCLLSMIWPLTEVPEAATQKHARSIKDLKGGHSVRIEAPQELNRRWLGSGGGERSRSPRRARPGNPTTLRRIYRPLHAISVRLEVNIKFGGGRNDTRGPTAARHGRS